MNVANDVNALRARIGRDGKRLPSSIVRNCPKLRSLVCVTGSFSHPSFTCRSCCFARESDIIGTRVHTITSFALFRNNVDSRCGCPPRRGERVNELRDLVSGFIRFFSTFSRSRTVATVVPARVDRRLGAKQSWRTTPTTPPTVVTKREIVCGTEGSLSGSGSSPPVDYFLDPSCRDMPHPCSAKYKVPHEEANVKARRDSNVERRRNPMAASGVSSPRDSIASSFI